MAARRQHTQGILGSTSPPRPLCQQLAVFSGSSRESSKRQPPTGASPCRWRSYLPPPDEMSGKFPAMQATRRDPVWPRFPAIVRYQSGAAADPRKMKAPVSTYTPITKLEGFTDRGFPPVPALEANLTTFFGVKGVVDKTAPNT